MLELVYENACDITLDLTDALTALNKTTGEITDVIFIVKNDASDPDTSALLEKKLSNAEITLQSGTSIYIVSIDDTDYTDLVIGKTYLVFIGILYNPLTKFKELEPTSGFLKVKQDGIRQ